MFFRGGVAAIETRRSHIKWPRRVSMNGAKPGVSGPEHILCACEGPDTPRRQSQARK